jgi:hypothetical protein
LNRIADALLAQPELIDVVARDGSPAEDEVVPFPVVLEAWGERLLDRRERDLLLGNPNAYQRLSLAYLPVISPSDWEVAVSAADPDGGSDDDWWTVMVASPGGIGVTLPQNAAAGRLIAAFAGPAGRPDIIAYDPASSALVELGLGHCGPPSRGRCTPGLCGGCQPRRVWDKASGLGIQCRCADKAG